MNKFERNLAEEINMEKLPENSFEYSPEMINFLKRTRKKFIHFLKDFKDEIPEKIISGKMEYKCQRRNWFLILGLGIEEVDARLKKAGKQNSKISELTALAKELREKIKAEEEIKGSGRTTKEQIERGNEILRSAIEELDKIIGE